MLRRNLITTLCICGILATLIAPVRQQTQWVGDCAIVAVPPAIPVQSPESEGRKLPVSATAATLPKRQLRRIHFVVVEPRRVAPIPVRPVPAPPAPLPPELRERSPRAPPSVC
jgi:hypothetical protein